jgi:hypothetical protein
MLALDLVLGIAVLVLWPGSGVGTSEDASALYSQPAYLAVALVLGTMTTAIGGAICARWAPSLPYWNVAAFGSLSFVVGLLLAESTQPLWFTAVGSLLTMPAAIYGAYIGLRRSRQKQPRDA